MFLTNSSFGHTNSLILKLNYLRMSNIQQDEMSHCGNYRLWMIGDLFGEHLANDPSAKQQNNFRVAVRESVGDILLIVPTTFLSTREIISASQLN